MTTISSHHQRPAGHALLDIEISAKGQSRKLNYIADECISKKLVHAVGNALAELVSGSDKPQRLLISLFQIAGITHAELAYAEGEAANDSAEIDKRIELINTLMKANHPQGIDGGGKN